MRFVALLWIVFASCTSHAAGELPLVKDTEEVPSLTFVGMNRLNSRVIKVPAIPNAMAYVCFENKRKQNANCIYIHKDGYAFVETVSLPEVRT